MKYFFLFIFIACLSIACRREADHEQAAVETDHQIIATAETADTTDFDVMALIEIPTGTTEKWEFNKETSEMELELIGDVYRKVNYIGYPGNYGMLPGTLQAKEQGGDGDPLDILILGPPLNRGDTVACRIVGVLKLEDQGELDDKLIGVMKHTAFATILDISQLDELFPGVSDIIDIWFRNYKGTGKIKSTGFGSRAEAERIYQNSFVNK